MSTDGLRVGVKCFPHAGSACNSVQESLHGARGAGVKHTASMAIAPKFRNSVHIYITDDQLELLTRAVARLNAKTPHLKPCAPATFVRDVLALHLHKLERRE